MKRGRAPGSSRFGPAQTNSAQFLGAFVKAVCEAAQAGTGHPAFTRAFKALGTALHTLPERTTPITLITRGPGRTGGSVEGLQADFLELPDALDGHASPEEIDIFFRRLRLNHLALLTIDRSIGPTELGQLVGALGTHSHNPRDPESKSLTELLRAQHVSGVRVLCEADLLKARPMDWRVRIALTLASERLLGGYATGFAARVQRRKVLAEVTDSLVRSQVKEALLCVDVLTGARSDLPAEAIESDLVAVFSNPILKLVVEDLLKDMERFQKYSAEEDPEEDPLGARRDVVMMRTMRVLALAAKRLISEAQHEDAEIVARLVGLGLVPPEDVPASVRQISTVQRAFAGDAPSPDAIIEELEFGARGEEARLALGSAVQTFPQLVMAGLLEQAGLLGRAVHRWVHEGGDPELATGALRAMATPECLDVLAAKVAKAESREERVQPMRVLQILGPAAAQRVLDMLHSSEQRELRIELLSVITGWGNGAVAPISAALALRPPDWYFARNLVGLLGMVGHREDAGTVGHYAHHAHPRVREEALGALAKLLAKQSEPWLIEALEDEHDDVVRRALRHLGALKSAKPAVVQRIARIIDPEMTGGRPAPPELLIAAIETASHITHETLPWGETLEGLLLRVVRTRDPLNAYPDGGEGFEHRGRRLALVRALGDGGSLAALDALEEVSLDRDPQLRAAAMAASMAIRRRVPVVLTPTDAGEAEAEAAGEEAEALADGEAAAE